MDRDDEEMLELDAPRPANTSTSHTLVLSEEPRIAPESSAPTRSPRALKKKKARTGAAGGLRAGDEVSGATRGSLKRTSV